MSGGEVEVLEGVVVVLVEVEEEEVEEVEVVMQVVLEVLEERVREVEEEVVQLV